ncbi:MAG: CotH kinase family protein [Clostridia bacterium]|nr:CotH kinase family protein [Clostridia bacterium]
MDRKRFLFTAMCILLLSVLLFACAQAENGLVINEVMASNATFTDGQSYDWVEIYNPASAQVSLKGWHLSNDPYQLKKWAFPDTAKIAKGGYLIVYCAGDNVQDPKKDTLYTPFKLSADGEELYLTNPKGETVSLKFGTQYGNVSYGLDGKGNYRFLETATPGKKNDSQGYTGQAPIPVIETAAGFYKDSVTVTISAPEGVEIRYTTDCNTPSRESKLYTGPFKVSKTTVVRARTFASNLVGSPTAGSTFFINEEAPAAVISFYTDDALLYSNKSGMMVKGSGKTANYNKDWEYPFQIEYFDQDGVRQIVQMCTGKIAGHSSRSLRQKSFSIYARSAFGSDTFDFNFFDNREYTSYSALQLRMTNSDYRSCRLRDCVLMEVSEGLGLYYQAGRPVVMYLNGEYYGHYNLREKANKDSLAQWEGITDKKVIAGCDIIEGTGMNETSIIRGSNDDWVELMNYCKKNNLNDPEKLQYVLDRLDVDSMFNYVIFSSVIGNYDSGNVRYYRFPGEKWKFMLHDVEAGCMNDDEAPVSTFLRSSKTASASKFPHWALTALLQVPEYKDMFMRRVAEIIESNFLYYKDVQPIYLKWHDALEPILQRHVKKFNHINLKDWETNVNASMYYARIRPKKVINYICTNLKVNKTDKAAYFGEVLELLEIYNGKNPPK